MSSDIGEYSDSLARDAAHVEQDEDHPPHVSVCVITYNHSAFIRSCLDSIISQDVSFPIEIIIGDDASSDDTPMILKEYAARFPALIRTKFHERNLGPSGNYRLVHGMARGRYVAHLDGDDLMLPGRLSAQAERLDREAGLAGVFHRLEIIHADGARAGTFWPASAPERFDLEFLVRHHPVVGHSSMMYRRGCLQELLLCDDDFIDFRAYVELALHGDLGYDSACLGQYRQGVGTARDHYKWIPYCLAALDFAERYGVDPGAIRYGRAHQNFLASHTALWGRNFVRFRELIVASWGWGRVSVVQQVFYRLRRAPALLLLLHHGYVHMRRLGFVRDLKRNF